RLGGFRFPRTVGVALALAIRPFFGFAFFGFDFEFFFFAFRFAFGLSNRIAAFFTVFSFGLFDLGFRRDGIAERVVHLVHHGFFIFRHGASYRAVKLSWSHSRRS